MGCAASKLDSEDNVRRCKERRRLMKEAVYARHHLAAAQADYIRSLRFTGLALTEFAKGESLSVSDQTPAVFLHPNQPSTPPLTPPSTNSFHHIPSPSFQPPSSPSVASSKVSNKFSSYQNQRRRKPPKLPHILSESSFSSSPTSQKSNIFANFPTAFQANSTYSNTPSQASSMWNWENFYPPSPPDSEFFQRRTEIQQHNRHENHSQLDDDEGTERSGYNLFPKKQEHDQTHTFRMKTNGSQIGEETEREEVQCSEWGDHYSTTTSSEDEDDCESRSEIGTRSNYGSSRHGSVKQPEPMMYGGAGGKSHKLDEAGSSVSYGKSEISDMKIVVRHKDLKEIVEAIQENFEKAAEAGEKVSEILEVGRAQLDRSFSQLKKTVYHSSSILSNLSSSWTSKPPLVVKYRFDAASLNEPSGGKNLCCTLERLLAWEKKLYDEVKAREGVKIQHEKKLSALQSQEYKGEGEVKLDKTKTSIKRLHSLIIVSSQAASTTFNAIAGLRDSDLVPQLVELCHGFMYMWRSMHQYHEIQNNIVQQVRGLVNQSDKGDPTSELHRQATRELESAVSAWHSSFCRLIKFQREFIRALHGWFKLTLLPVNNDSVGVNTEPSEVYVFCDEWKLSLDRVPDTVASEAIKSFINVVHVISVKQSEEFKVKKQTESASKELEKKASSLRNIEKKFYHSYSTVGIRLPDPGSDNGHVLDARDPLAEKKSELTACQRRVEDEMLRHSKAVSVTRAMTLNNLQTGLPGVFQALTSFSALFTEALDAVCTRSYAIK